MAVERQSQTQEQTQGLVTIHILAFAHVTLHRPLISTYGHSGRQCAEATLGVVRVLDQMGELGAVGKISPIYAVRPVLHFCAPKSSIDAVTVDRLAGTVPCVARRDSASTRTTGCVASTRGRGDVAGDPKAGGHVECVIAEMSEQV